MFCGCFFLFVFSRGVFFKHFVCFVFHFFKNCLFLCVEQVVVICVQVVWLCLQVVFGCGQVVAVWRLWRAPLALKLCASVFFGVSLGVWRCSSCFCVCSSCFGVCSSCVNFVSSCFGVCAFGARLWRTSCV